MVAFGIRMDMAEMGRNVAFWPVADIELHLKLQQRSPFQTLSKYSVNPIRCWLLSPRGLHAAAGISRCHGWCCGVAADGQRTTAHASGVWHSPYIFAGGRTNLHSAATRLYASAGLCGRSQYR